MRQRAFLGRVSGATLAAAWLALLQPAGAETLSKAAYGSGAPAALAPDAGAYLAARIASRSNDFEQAAELFEAALEGDPGNVALTERAISAHLAAADIVKAARLASELDAGGGRSQLADMVRLAHAASEKHWREIFALFESGRSVGPLVDALAQGWAYVGLGRLDKAVDRFERLEETPGLAPFARFHKALALAQAGEYERAEATLSGAEGPLAGPGPGRVALAHAQVLGQLGRHAAALARLDEAFPPDTDPRISDLRAALAAGKSGGFDFVPDARAGLGEAFLAAAALLEGETEPRYAILYARLAEYLDPANAKTLLLTAHLLEEMKRPDLAQATYARLPEQHPAAPTLALARAQGLRAEGRPKEAVALLEKLLTSHGQVAEVNAALGHGLRELGRLGPAQEAYTRALETAAEGPDRWVLHFSRGVAREQLGDWTGARADFETALELNPGQPQVLNFLGYAMVEQGEDLERALGLIERAQEARPENGAITDSLGWALYRLGRTREALPHLERAASLEPLDPVINDHLGDAYWTAGRQIEARFQWRRALGFGPAPESATDIKRKLAVGLDRATEDQDDPIEMAHDDSR